MSCSSDEKHVAYSAGGQGGAPEELGEAGRSDAAGSSTRAGSAGAAGASEAMGRGGAAGVAEGGAGANSAGGLRTDGGAGDATTAGGHDGGAAGSGGLTCCDAGEFRASSQVLPHVACPAWGLVDNAEPEQPGFVVGALRLSSSTNAENLYYGVAAEDLSLPSMLVIEARVKLISGTSSTPSRAPASFGFSYGSTHQKNFLQIANGSIFLLESENVAGAAASVATTDDFHVYRLEVDTETGSVEAFYDGVSKLKGATFVDPNGSPPYILFGEVSLFATGISDWDYVTHNAFHCAE